MKTIKFYKTKGFDFQETLWKSYVYPCGTKQLVPYRIDHKVAGDIAVVDNRHVYYAYKLHDVPPAPAMTTDSTYNDVGTDAVADDQKFYLRKGTDRVKPIYEDDEQVGVEEYYQPHVIDFFNKGGFTYILFAPSFGGGEFALRSERILSKRKTLDRNNLYYRKTPEGLIGLNWI